MPAVVTPFSPRFSANANGDIAFVANTLMTAPGNASGAANAQAGTGTKLNNNDFSMVYVDVDSNGSTFNSSRADLALPAGGSVLFAGLYWGAQSSSSSRNQVLFQVPGSANYTTVTGSVVGSLSTGDYSAFADVTAQVRAGGVGTYGVANVQATTGSDQEAGWSLVIAYGDPAAPPRNLTVFDGFAVVDTKTPNVTIGISGFKAPLTGTVNASLGFLTFEGDKGYTGDSVKLNGTTLSDSENPADNFFNSTISNRGTLATAKNPNFVNQMGLDADIITKSGLIANGATSASIALTTGNETYYPAVVTTAIDLYAPVVSVAKSVQDLNGGAVRPGDILEYTNTVQVAAGEAATKFVLADAIPANTTYVPGSLLISNVAMTDATGDDQGSFEGANDRVVFRLGTGANATTGGTLAVGGTATVRFRVQVNATAVDKSTINSQATATFTGQSTLANLSASSGLAALTVERPADLAVAQTASNNEPNVGDLVTFVITVSYGDDIPVGGVVVNDKLPAGLTYVSSSPGQGTYDPATGAWAVGTLNTSASLTIVARVVATSAVTNTATITASDQPDPVTTNNTSALTITPLRADLGLTKTVSSATPNLGQRITFVTTLTNFGPNASTNITILDKLPAGFTVVSAVASGGVYDSGTGQWVISVVGSDPATLTIVADVSSVAASVASASILAADMYDPTSANNTALVAVTPQKVDLAVSKTVDNARPNVGDLIVLTTRVANAGPSAATGLILNTAVGAGLTFVSFQAGQGSYDPSSGVWTVGSVASVGEAVLRVTVRVASADALTSAASVAQLDQSDTAPNNNTASVAITPRKADLALSQTVDKATPNVGDTVTFTITLGNAGPDAATVVKVRDALPAGFQYLSSTATLGSYDPSTSLWTLGTVPSSTLQTLTLVARVIAPNAAANTASVFTVEQFDPNPANNTATATSTPQQVDLGLASSFSASRPNVGDVIQYTVAITAPGPGTATGVVVNVPLPAGLIYAGASVGAGTYDPASGVWNVGTVPPGAPILLTISAQLTGTTTTTATATVSSSTQFDPNGANNTATASVTPQRSDLALASSISNTAPNVGDRLTLTLTLSNTGPDAATGVVIADLLPAGLGFVSATGAGVYDPATGAWTLGTVASGGQGTLTIVATVNDPGAATVNASVASVAQYDPTATDNTSSVAYKPLQAALAVSVTADNTSPNAGDLVTFVVTLNNTGPDAATGVRVRDLIPTGFRLRSATASSGTYATGIGVWSVGTLGSGGAATLTIQASSAGGTPATMTATIIAADQFDPTAADNTASVSVAPRVSDLAFRIDAFPLRPNVGEPVTVIVYLRNDGPDEATNVLGLTTPPPGFEFINADVGSGFYDRFTGLWTIPSLAPGEEGFLYLTYTNTLPLPGDYRASLIRADQFDPTDANNATSATFTPLQADLGIAAAVDVARPDKGQVVSFTVTVTNTGPDDATDVVASALLPAGFTFVDSTATSGSYDAGTGDWSVGTVSPGTPRVLTIRAAVNAAATAVLATAITFANQFDGSSTNNSAQVFVRPKKVDLVVGKVVSNPTPNVGNRITYTISVTNGGSDTATGVVLGDTLPSGITFVSAGADQGTYNSGTGVWTVGSLAPGAEATLTLVADVTNASATINQAAVQAVNQFDTNSTNDGAQTSVSPQQAELRLINLVNNPSPLIGDVITFTVSIKNLGPDAATGIAVSVPLPAGLTFSSDDALGSYDSSTGTWTVGALASGSSRVLTLRATVTELGATTTTATIIQADQFDPNPADDTAQALTAAQQADVGLTFSIDDERPNVGDEITLTLTVANRGGDDATGLLVGVPLPAGLVFVSGTPELGSFDSATRIWTPGPLAAGASARLALRVRVASGDPIAIAANVSALDQTDPVADDNAISVTVTPRRADLALGVAVDNTRPNVGDQVEFTLALTNLGPDSATAIRVLDALPAGLTFLSATAGRGEFDPATGTWLVGSLAPGTSVFLTIRARVVSVLPSTNTATIATADQFDPDLVNQTGTVTVTPRLADLAATITADVTRPNVGDEILLTITVHNNGPDDAHAVTLLNALPNGLVAVAATPDQGDFSLSSGVWSVGTVTAGTTRTLLVRVRVVEAGVLVNNLAITSADEADLSLGDNVATAVVTPLVANLGLTLGVDQARPNVGDLVTFTLTLTNAGPDAATGVRVESLLPLGFDFVSSTGSGSYNPATGTWTLGEVNPGGPVVLQIVARVTRAEAVTASAAIVRVDQFDPTADNGLASVTVTPQQSDLAMTTTVDNLQPNVGDRVTITITLTATGDPATGVVVGMPLPFGLSFESSDAGVDYDPGTGQWLVGTVAPGTPRVLRIVAVVTATGTITPTASVTHADQADPSPGNNTANASITPQQSDLALTMVVDNASPAAGEVVTYTLTLTNSGPDVATHAVIGQQLPEGYEFVSATPGSGTFDPSTGTWSVASLAPGASTTLQIQVRVARPGASVATARVVSVDQADPTPVTLVSVVVVPQGVDLSVRAEGMPSLVVVGQQFEVRIIASNAGPDGATGVTIPIAIPRGFRLVAATPGQGSYDPTTGLWSLGSVPAGGSVELRLTLEAVAAGSQEIVAGPVHSAQFDGSAANDVARPSVEIEPDVVVIVDPIPGPVVGRSRLGGRVFDDRTGSGVGNVSVVLEGTDVEGNVVRLVAITAPDGSYQFSRLLAGVYSLTIASAEGTGVAGNLGGQVSGGRINNIILGDDTTGESYAFAARVASPVALNPEVATGRLTGFVYLDRNRNGRYNPGRDLGIATIRVILTGVDDRGQAVRRETTTDATGAYLFVGLRPGTYAIKDVPNRFFRGSRLLVAASGGANLGRRVSGVILAAGGSAEVDFGKLPLPGCRLIPLIGTSGTLPRGPRLARFFPSLASARSVASRSTR